jgi:hypothetical protein
MVMGSCPNALTGLGIKQVAMFGMDMDRDLIVDLGPIAFLSLDRDQSTGDPD